MSNRVRGYLVEAILFIAYLLFGINWVVGSMFTREIMVSFELDGYSQATLISNAITGAKIIGNLVAAWILIKFKPKWAVGLAMGCMVSGALLSAMVTSYPLFVLMRFVLGFGAALQVVYFSTFVVHYFPPDQRSAMNSFNGCAYTMGSMITMIIFDPIVHWLEHWQTVILFFGSLSGVLLILWFVVGENFHLYSPKNEKESAKKEYTFLEGLKDPLNYILPFTYSGALLLYLTILTLFPLYQEAAYSANNLAMIVGFFAIVGAIIGVHLLKKGHSRIQMLRLSGVGVIFFGWLMIYTSQATIAVIAAIFLGISLYIANSVLLSLPQELPGITPGKITFVMGFYWSFAYILETINYYFIGRVMDAYGFKMGMYLAVALSVTVVVGSFFLPETKKSKN